MSTILTQAFNSSSVPIPTTTETAIMSTAVLYSGEQSGVYVGGSFRVTPGTGTTAVVLKVRQGVGVSGTTVYTSPSIPVTAGNATDLALDIMDTTGVINGPAGTAYTVTITQTGATANGSVNDNYFRVEQQ
jgi:hypothetical protein